MTIHVNRKTLKIFKERYKVGIHKKTVYRQYTKKIFRYLKRYKCVLVYVWYTKVIEKILNQKLRYTKRYMKILVYE